MSLSTIRMFDVVRKQYRYKLKAYSQVFVSLMMLQIIAIIFSLGGVGSMGHSSNMMQVDISYYSADMVVAFTLLWGFITAILTTTKAYRNDDFVFITNRMTSNLSNLLFLATASIAGGVTAMLSTFLLRMIMYFFHFSLSLNTTMGAADFFLGMFTTSLYIFLFCGLGYLTGTLVQISKLFIVLLPALLIGSAFVAGITGNTGLIEILFRFFFKESSIIAFIGKSVGSGFLLYACAFLMSNRLEVKQG